jgi:hypothetical protein
MYPVFCGGRLPAQDSPGSWPRRMSCADVLCGSTDPGAAFEFAVDLLIGGLEKLLERKLAAQ